MNRIVTLALLVVLGAASVEPAFAGRRVVVRRGPHRTTVVVRRGHPIRRALPVVVVRPARVAVVRPVVFLAPVVWTAAVITVPASKTVVWSDAEVLEREDDWTDFTLGCDRRGDAMFVEIDGKAQLEFAEVVFENGDARVVDFKEWTRGSGHYALVDFADGRKVDHVRVVARARSERATLTLKLVS